VRASRPATSRRRSRPCPCSSSPAMSSSVPRSIVAGFADRKNRGTFRRTTPRRLGEGPALTACEDTGDERPG
jgi:hypothetical protein